MEKYHEIIYIGILLIFSIIALIIFFILPPFVEVDEKYEFIYDNYNKQYELYKNGLLNIDNLNIEDVNTTKLLHYFNYFEENNIIKKIRNNKFKKVSLTIALYFMIIVFIVGIIFHKDVTKFIEKYKK